MKAEGKIKSEDPDSKDMMRSIRESLEAIKVNLAENRRPRWIDPTSRTNVRCARCGGPGHFASECQKEAQKRIHYANPEEEVFYAMPDEEEEEIQAIYQVQLTYGRGKSLKPPIQSGMISNQNFQAGSS